MTLPHVQAISGALPTHQENMARVAILLAKAVKG